MRIPRAGDHVHITADGMSGYGMVVRVEERVDQIVVSGPGRPETMAGHRRMTLTIVLEPQQ